MPIHPAEILTRDQVAQIHETALAVLAEIGLLVRNAKARDRFRHHGCAVDADTQRVKLPRRVVEEMRAAIPPTFTFHGRVPEFDKTIPGDALVVGTASSAPNLLDPDSGQERRARSDDIARLGHLIGALDGIDVFSVSVLADDAPPGQFSLSRFYPALKNCAKPVRASAINVAEAAQVVRLAEIIAGGAEAFRARPFLTFGYCAVISPLTMDVDSTELLMYYAENGLPAYNALAPIGGLSAPLSVLGMLAQLNAEWLAASVLAQMSRPGTKLVYQALPVIGDMRTGAYASGAVETGILAMAMVQLARFYNVPCGAYLGLTNSKLTDAQAGYEKALAPALGALAGIDFMLMGGLIDAGMTFDFGQVVIDNEIAMMIKRLRQDLTLGDLSGAFDEIRAIGPGGTYLKSPRTRAQMRTAAFFPAVADRQSRESWAKGGGTDAHNRAKAIARAVLAQPNPAALSAEIDDRVREAFPGLVSGDSRPCGGIERRKMA